MTDEEIFKAAFSVPATFVNAIQVSAGNGFVRIAVGEVNPPHVDVQFRCAILMNAADAETLCQTIQNAIKGATEAHKQALARAN